MTIEIIIAVIALVIMAIAMVPAIKAAKVAAKREALVKANRARTSFLRKKVSTAGMQAKHRWFAYYYGYGFSYYSGHPYVRSKLDRYEMFKQLMSIYNFTCESVREYCSGFVSNISYDDLCKKVAELCRYESMEYSIKAVKQLVFNQINPVFTLEFAQPDNEGYDCYRTNHKALINEIGSLYNCRNHKLSGESRYVGEGNHRQHSAKYSRKSRGCASIRSAIKEYSWELAE